MNTVAEILLLDTTLREGEQSQGIFFSLSEKIEIAQRLQRYGVDLIEVGHPGISPIEEEICRKVCESIHCAETLVHARACEQEIIAAKNAKADWVGIWASYNDISLETKYKCKSREWIREQVKNSIQFAKELGLKVRFTIEDASRTEFILIEELCSLALAAGADRISLADTVGAWHPKKCYNVVQFVVNRFKCELEVHLHNDLGLAHANAIAAIDAGAKVIDVSSLGIGERAGICDLFSLSVSLNKFYGKNNYKFHEAKEIANIISRIGSFSVEPHHPIIGKNVFTHVSKYHVKAAEKKPISYEFLTPNDFGVKRKLCNNNFERIFANRFLNNLQIKKPFIKGSSELKFHRDGVGDRWVFMDARIDERSPFYIIERIFEKDYSDSYQAHVDSHTHHCDSVFVFMGNNKDGSGLVAKVTLGEETKVVFSPTTIFIPAYISHSYSYVSGIGRFLNFVMSPDYNLSLV